jgi:hypothetical protein
MRHQATATGMHPELLRRLGRDIEVARKFSPVQRADAARQGIAMPDGSYPIYNAGDLSDAVRDYQRMGQPKAVKAHIVKRAEALGADLPAGFES